MYENVIYGRGGIADHKRKDRYSIFGVGQLVVHMGQVKLDSTPHPTHHNKGIKT